MGMKDVIAAKVANGASMEEAREAAVESRARQLVGDEQIDVASAEARARAELDAETQPEPDEMWRILRLHEDDPAELPNGVTAEWRELAPHALNDRWPSIPPDASELGGAYGEGHYMILAPHRPHYGGREVQFVTVVARTEYIEAQAE